MPRLDPLVNGERRFERFHGFRRGPQVIPQRRRLGVGRELVDERLCPLQQVQRGGDDPGEHHRKQRQFRHRQPGPGNRMPGESGQRGGHDELDQGQRGAHRQLQQLEGRPANPPDAVGQRVLNVGPPPAQNLAPVGAGNRGVEFPAESIRELQPKPGRQHTPVPGGGADRRQAEKHGQNARQVEGHAQGCRNFRRRLHNRRSVAASIRHSGDLQQRNDHRSPSRPVAARRSTCRRRQPELPA